MGQQQKRNVADVPTLPLFVYKKKHEEPLRGEETSLCLSDNKKRTLTFTLFVRNIPICRAVAKTFFGGDESRGYPLTEFWRGATKNDFTVGQSSFGQDERRQLGSRPSSESLGSSRAKENGKERERVERDQSAVDGCLRLSSKFIKLLRL